MRSVDVHDLPEPLAKALYSMVQRVRNALNAHSVAGNELNRGVASEIFAPLIAEMRRLHCEIPTAELKALQTEVEKVLVDKYSN